MESSKADSVLYGMTDYGPAQGSHMLRKFSTFTSKLAYLFLGRAKLIILYYSFLKYVLNICHEVNKCCYEVV